MPVLPLVGSTITEPGAILPSASAASIIATPMRSLTEPPGLRYSSFATTSPPIPSPSRCSATSGVLPTAPEASGERRRPRVLGIGAHGPETSGRLGCADGFHRRCRRGADRSPQPLRAGRLARRAPVRRQAEAGDRPPARRGAGKAEARTLALQALEKVGGEVTEGTQRGGPMERHTESVEGWVIPLDAVRW